MLKALLTVVCLALPLATIAQEKKTPQQEKMATCNKDAGAKNLKGDERKKFMSECLSAHSGGPSTAQHAQQDKMTTCNKEAGAKDLRGDERKKFMSTCLKG